MTAAAGVRAVAVAAGAALDDAVAAAGEQLELIAPTRFAEGDERRDKTMAAVKRNVAGRPPGARNLATRDVVEFVRRVFGDPMIESARWLLLSPDAMAAELGCSKAEAWDRQERIRADLRRFMYAPLAPVDGAGNAVAPTFVMAIGGRVAGADGRPPWDYDGGPEQPVETQQNQALLASSDPATHEAATHEASK